MGDDDKRSMELANADRIIEYSAGIADEFLARHNRIRNFVTEHNLTSGTANEMILRNFLAEHSTGKFAVGQGFIYDPAVSNQDTEYFVSKQCDIIVYDRDYPLVHSEGEVEIVLPESVKLFMEVKTKLTKSALIGTKKQKKKKELNLTTSTQRQGGALDNISAAKQVSCMNLTPGLIFAFKSSKVRTIVKHLREYPKKLPIEHWPTAILLLNEGIIIHRGDDLKGVETETYKVRKGNNDEKATVMAFLILFYLEKITESLCGGSTFVNILNRMLAYRTKEAKDLTDFRLGENG